MKLKFNKSILFFIILGVLLFVHFSIGVREYFEDGSSSISAVSDKDTDTPDALPKGIPKSQIPNGDEDLYILKSQVVPPVCPKCPDVKVCPKAAPEKCPPCPPCARCPEPAFECKKVPNYNRKDEAYLPLPVLSDFSQFGM